MQKVLVTGGNRGIGLEIVKLFVRNNYEVIIIARNFDNFPQELENKVKQITFDLQNLSGIPQVVLDIGEIDILINNAGIMNSLPFDKYPVDKRDAMIKINLEAPIELITLFSKAMIAKKQGRIVSVASIAGEIGHPDIWYGITKAGIINMTKSFAKLLGTHGIVINCVAPGPVKTDMFETIPLERRETILKNTVTNRPATPEEISQTIYWLATDAPEYINGTCIDINNTAFLR